MFFEKHQNIWQYEVIINGNVVQAIENQEPKEFNNVKFYAANPWQDAFTAEYGSVWGMIVNDFPISHGR